MSMNVKDLRRALADVPEEFEVVLSSDAEGNGFSPLSDWNLGEYQPETTWCGEVLHSEDQEGPDNALVLWPVN